MRQWYVFHTKPNAERLVEAYLARVRELETFLPLYRERRGGPERPFFPCYLFARFEYERSGLGELRWTPGLRRIIAFEDRPAPVLDQAIRLLQERLDALPGGLLSPAQRLKPGQRVRITQGPLASLEGLFEGTLNGHDRVAVLVDFIRQNSRVVVPAAWVERAGPPPRRAHPPRRTRGRGRRIKRPSSSS